MSAFYVFSDPLTELPRLFYGYLYDCRLETPGGCPYAMKIDNGFYCNHPHGHDCRCGKPKG